MFDRSKFRLGIRTFKAGIAVFWFWFLVSLAGGACRLGLTAVFRFEKILILRCFARDGQQHRCFMPCCSLWSRFSSTMLLGDPDFVPIATMLTIMTNVAMNNKAGIIGGVSARHHHPLDSDRRNVPICFARIFETFIGVFVAILVNSVGSDSGLYKWKTMWVMWHFNLDIVFFLRYNRMERVLYEERN